MTDQTKGELVEELASHVTKDDLVKLLGSRLKKDELAQVLDDEDGDATKEQLVRRLASRTKDVLVQALGAHLTKEELQRIVDRISARELDPYSAASDLLKRASG